MKIRAIVSNNIILFSFLVSSVAFMPAVASGFVCYRYEAGYSVADDWDDDGALDAVDNCPQSFNPDMDDYDDDGVGDVCDSCPLVRNQAQTDLDRDGIGDACDDDIDGDMILNPRGLVAGDALDTATDSVVVFDISDSGTTSDTSAGVVDTVSDTETVTDGMIVSTESETGTATEADTVANTGTDDTQTDFAVLQVLDNCPKTYNPRQEDQDGDGEGDACDPDVDGDGVVNELDFCPFDSAVSAYVSDAVHTSLQCLGDSDEDSVLNFQVVNGELLPLDNCQYVANPSQTDLDGDGVGDDCDSDVDGDNVVDSKDNCTYSAFFNDIVADIENLHLLKASNPNTTETCAIEAGNISDLDIESLSAQEKATMLLATMSNADLLGFLQNTAQEDLDRDRLGDSCDRDFCKVGYPFGNCFVVNDDEANCLEIGNPALKVYSPRVIASKTDDDPVRLRIFANRENERLRYNWRLEEGDPDGIDLHNATGEVSCSSGYEYHYRTYAKSGAISGTDDTQVDEDEIVDMAATYETHLEGSYVLRLKVVALDANGMPKSGELNSDEVSVTVNVSGSDDYIADDCGCEVVGHPGAGAWSGLLLALMVALAFLLRRLIRL